MPSFAGLCVPKDLTMNVIAMAISLIDNGGRRLGVDRRQFSYTNHIPDRRLGEDRRTTGLDRRSGLDLKEEKDRRSSLERRAAFSTALSS